MSVGKRSVERVDQVVDYAAPEIVRAVELGKLSISAAAMAARLDDEQQKRIAERAEAGDAQAVRTVIKQGRRATRERELGTRQIVLPQRKYGVIFADPEWRYQVRSRATGMDRVADNHYPTSATEVIATRDVASMAAEDCVLFLCATIPMLRHAFVVMEAWGFNYVSNYVLEKDRIITGHWNRNRHEHLLIGTRGRVPCPAPGKQWESLIPAPVGDHSAKPPGMLEMLEQYFPTLPKIELNRRGAARPGWDAWGNEVMESNEAPNVGEQATG